MFKDRKNAGQKLGKALIEYKNQNPVILAIPCGGVEVGVEVARILQASLSLIIVRKLPFPQNPESGFGAVAEDGSTYMIPDVKYIVNSKTIEKVTEIQHQEVLRRIHILRKDAPLFDIKDRVVILVDDGIAMGSTMRAAIMCCKNKKAKKIIVAAPVGSPRVAIHFKKFVDDVVIIEKPYYFQAVAEAYLNWYDVSDEEVIQLLQTQ